MWITASVKSTNGFDYVIYRYSDGEDKEFYPYQLGYDVRWVSDCKAAFLKKGKTTYITCDPHLIDMSLEKRSDKFDFSLFETNTIDSN